MAKQSSKPAVDCNPGPVDGSVLVDQKTHRSQAIADGTNTQTVRFIEHGQLFSRWHMTHPGVLALLRQAGFYTATRLRYIKLDHALLGALLERWRRETQSFHLRNGEMTILLQDVALLAGLRVDGDAVVGRTDIVWEDLCIELLGVLPDPPDYQDGSIKLDWLVTHFKDIPDDASEQQVEHTARAYILFFLGCHVFPDTSGHMVHLRYLQLLRDFEECGRVAWGAAVLAYLYRELSKGCIASKARSCGYFTLVQLWSWMHLTLSRPCMLPRRPRDAAPADDGALGCKWNGRLEFKTNAKVSNIKFYREQLDLQGSEAVTWNPYTAEDISKLPEICTQGSHIWRSRVPLICFEIVEMHVPDRVMRQLNMVQHIPVPVERIDRFTRQGRQEGDWVQYHAQHVQRWAEREEHLIAQQFDSTMDPTEATETYMRWYWSITRRWICRPTEAPSVTYQTRGHVERVLVDSYRRVEANLRSLLSTRLDPLETARTLSDILAFMSQTFQQLPLSLTSEPPVNCHEDEAGPDTSVACLRGRRKRKCATLPSAASDPLLTSLSLTPDLCSICETETLRPTFSSPSLIAAVDNDLSIEVGTQVTQEAETHRESLSLRKYRRRDRGSEGGKFSGGMHPRSMSPPRGPRETEVLPIASIPEETMAAYEALSQPESELLTTEKALVQVRDASMESEEALINVCEEALVQVAEEAMTSEEAPTREDSMLLEGA